MCTVNLSHYIYTATYIEHVAFIIDYFVSRDPSVSLRSNRVVGFPRIFIDFLRVNILPIPLSETVGTWVDPITGANLGAEIGGGPAELSAALRSDRPLSRTEVVASRYPSAIDTSPCGSNELGQSCLTRTCTDRCNLHLVPPTICRNRAFQHFARWSYVCVCVCVLHYKYLHLSLFQ